jgi:class 3 adenylate cyclase
VAEIDFCFKAFDGIITAQGLEKIKTVGDAYIAVSGLPLADPEHAKKVVAAGLEIRAFMQLRKESYPGSFEIRLGIHSGPVVAGIVGVKKFAYDIWGDTVNTAARMEQYSEPGRLNISGATYELVRDHFRCTLRGELEVKNKGKMKMYFVG